MQMMRLHNACFAFAGFVWTALCPLVASADDDIRPVARILIYPGDTIAAEMIEERKVALRAGTAQQFARTPHQVVGKTARRTILPGQVIALSGVREPEVVRSGMPVILQFSSGELVITSRGLAVQAGAIGDIISVQNVDSNTLVRGKVQPDGTVRLED